MRLNLARDPAVLHIAAILGWDDPDFVVGKLHHLWAWASEQLADGNARGVTEKAVDYMLRVPGFAAAMREAGWLCITGKGINFPKFEEYMSESAKKRALGRERTAKNRAKNVTLGALQNEGESVTPSSSSSSSSSSDPKEEGIKKVFDPAYTGDHIGFTEAEVSRLRAGSKTHPPMAEEEIRYWLSQLDYAKSRTRKWAFTDLAATARNWRVRAIEEGKAWDVEQRAYCKNGHGDKRKFQFKPVPFPEVEA